MSEIETIGISMTKKYRGTIGGCLAGGILAHFYVLTNILQNHDSIAMAPKGYGTGITSGRWFLTVLGQFIGKLGGNYNLPYFNGIIAICLLTITACLIVDIFQLPDKYGFLFGAVFVSFPTVTGTLFYMYTTIYYTLAILMAIMAVWCTEKFTFGFLAAIVLEACSLGIYQAYLPMTAALFVLLLIVKSLNEEQSIWDIVKGGAFYLFVLASGFILYYICLVNCLVRYRTSLSTYMNVNHMGRITLNDISGIIEKCYSNFYRLPFEDYCGITSTPVLRFCVLILAIAAVGSLILLWRLKKEKTSKIMFCILLCLVIFPAAVNGIEILCFNAGYIYVLMVYGTVFIFLLPLLLLNLAENAFLKSEQVWSSIKGKVFRLAKNMVVVVMIAVFISYAYLANVNYTALFYMNQQTTNYLSELVTQIKSVEGYQTSYQVAFIGDTIQDPSFGNPWESVPKYAGNPNSLINEYSRDYYIINYLGSWYEPANQWKTQALKEHDIVKQMPCYPNSGSIKVLDNTIVVKLSD